MKTGIPEGLEYLIQHAQMLRKTLAMNEISSNLTIESAINNQTSFFNRVELRTRQQDIKSIEEELHNWFLNHTDSKLQDRSANYLIHQIKTIFSPIQGYIDNIIDNYQYAEEHKLEDQYKFICANGSYCTALKPLVESWLYILREVVGIYAPESYAKHKTLLDKLLTERDEFGDEIVRPVSQLQPAEPDIKNTKETHTKDQILLLSELGVLDLPTINNMTTENKGKLFARLLNRNEKNVTEYIRNCDPNGNRQAEDNPYIYENKVDAINQLLKSVGFLKKL